MSGAAVSTNAGGPARKENESTMTGLSGVPPLPRLTYWTVAAALMVAAIVGVLTGPAWAGYVATESFSGPGSSDGELTTPGRAAIETSTGNLFVVDRGNDRVQVFAASGGSVSYLTQFGNGELDDPFGIAIDQAEGDVFVSDAANDRIVKYTGDGAPVPAFSIDGGFTSPLGGAGVGRIGAFNVSLAIDPISGDLLVADRQNDRISRYDGDSGAFKSSFDGSSSGSAFTGLLDVTTDSTGDVLVVDSATGRLSDLINGSSSRVERFDATGTWEATVGPVDGAGIVAVDPDDDRVLVGANFQSYYNGAPLTVHYFAPGGSSLASASLTSPSVYGVTPGLAASAGGADHTYAITDLDPFSQSWGAVGGQVIQDVPPPTAAIEPTTDIAALDAVAHGTVNAQGLDGSYRFERSEDGATWIQGFSNEIVGEGDVAVQTDMGGFPFDQSTQIEPNTEYRIRLVATTPAGTTTSGEDVFTTAAVAPSVLTNQAVSGVTTTLGRLVGRVNPHNSPTSYHFEYGIDTGYGQSTPTVQVPDGNVGRFVSEEVSGLTADTTYHYRLVAANPAGTTTGPDRTFTTRAAEHEPPAAKDPVVPGRGFLPDNRGWEKVSPEDKGDSEIRLSANFQAAADGDSAVLVADGAFAGADAGMVLGQYLATRGPDGWSTKSIATPMGGGDMFRGDWIPGFSAYSSDLERGVLRSSIGDAGLVPEADSRVRNLYVLTPGGDDARLVTPAPDPVPDPSTAFWTLPPIFGQATPNFERIVFEARYPLTPDAPAGVTNLYEWVDGDIRLVNVNPDGSPMAAGGVLGNGGLYSTYLSRFMAGSLSEDGSRVFFTSAPDAERDPWASGDPNVRLYMREDGATTTEISASQRTSPSAIGPKPIGFETASADGSRVFFQTCQELTDDATVPPTSSGLCGQMSRDLYMYEVEAGDLTNLSAGDPQGAYVVDLIASSRNGEHVYFVANGLLDGDRGERGADNLYVWHEGDVRYVATLASGEFEADRFNYQRPLARMMPDGRSLMFATARRLTDGDNAGRRALYHYDYDVDAIACVSCRPDGEPSAAEVELEAEDGASSIMQTNAQYMHRVVDSAGRIYFQTADPLVAEDVNGAIDVYQYADGRARLISDGVGTYDAQFLDASENGDEVFFVTRNRLVRSDRDNFTDVYVARVDGGFPAPATAAPCFEDACQQPSGDRPTRTTPGSATLDGAGDSGAERRATLSLAVSRAQRLRLARGGRVALRVRVDRAGKVTVTARAVIGGRQRVVARGARLARRAGVVTVGLRLSKQARRRLAAHRRALPTILDVRFADASQRLTLRLQGRTGR